MSTNILKVIVGATPENMEKRILKDKNHVIEGHWAILSTFELTWVT